MNSTPMPPEGQRVSHNETCSLQHFRKFIKVSSSKDVDASRVFSLECYEQWVLSRKSVPQFPEETFRRVLTGHVRGSEGRKPFEPEEEAAILVELRKQIIWPCFIYSASTTRIGINGFRAKGFHEGRKDASPQKSIKDCQSIWRAKLAKGSPPITSYDVFSSFATMDHTGQCRILSSECFQTWVNTRKHGCKTPEYSFRKALVAHLCAKDGRRPFPEDQERMILEELRKKQPWPCFSASKKSHIKNIGKNGFSKSGFHEAKALDSSSSSETQIVKKFPAPSFPLKRCLSDEGELDNVKLETPKRKRVVPQFSLDLMPSSHEFEDLFFQTNSCSPSFQKVHLYNESDAFANTILDDDSFCRSALDPMEDWFPNCDFSSPQDDLPFLKMGIAESLTFSIPDTLINEQSILDTFEDVSAEEVVKVLQLRKLTRGLFEHHFRIVSLQIPGCEQFGSDVCGDVKLLRVLRTCGGNVGQAVEEIGEFLKWRIKYNVDGIRDHFVTANLSFEELKRSFLIGREGGCYPFFCQHDNGDITDIWVIQKQKKSSAKEIPESYNDHIRLAEYRSIILDRLSRLKRRVVCNRVIIDSCNVVQTDESKSHISSSSEEDDEEMMDWMSAIRVWTSYLANVNELGTRWYGGLTSVVHVFGTTFLFKKLFSLLVRNFSRKFYWGVIGGDARNHRAVLEQLFGEDMSKWPKMYGGTWSDPTGFGVSKRALSSYPVPRTNFIN